MTKTRKCRDCKSAMTKRVTYSGEIYKSKGQVRCGYCYLRNRKTYRFRKQVRGLIAVIGEDLIASCILEAGE